jgi:hypothetical protein
MLTRKKYLLCITPLRHRVSARNDERMNSDFFSKYFYAGIVQSNLCWKIHNKYFFRVNIHIFVLEYLVQIQIIQNQFKISEGGMLCTALALNIELLSINNRVCRFIDVILELRNNSWQA